MFVETKLAKMYNNWDNQEESFFINKFKKDPLYDSEKMYYIKYDSEYGVVLIMEILEETGTPL